MATDVKITLIEGGPAKVEGEVTIIHPDGKQEVKKGAFLCRCGKSQNLPWCDGSHAKK